MIRNILFSFICLIYTFSYWFDYFNEEYVHVSSNQFQVICETNRKSVLRVKLESNILIYGTKIESSLCKQIINENVREATLKGKYEKDKLFFNQLTINSLEIIESDERILSSVLSYLLVLFCFIFIFYIYPKQRKLNGSDSIDSEN